MWYYDEQFAAVNARLNTAIRLLYQVLQQNHQISQQEATLAIDLTAATAELAKNTSVSASAVQAINVLLAQLAAIPASSDPATQAAIDNIVANWQANDNAVAAAIANTPQTPVPVPPVVVVPPAPAA